MTVWSLGLALLWVIFLLAEQVLLRRARKAVPFRVLVTGTRGKSSLVRLLVAGARAAEPSTWGKITGDLPTLLCPEGDRLINRRGPACVGEQARLLMTCRKRNVRCLVVEAMTISPELMKAEAQLMAPSVVALVNVRDDHQETLGPDAGLQRKAYLDSLPAGVRWVSHDSGLPENGDCGVRVRRERSSSPSETDWMIGLDPLQRELAELADDVLAVLGWSTSESRTAVAAAALQIRNTPRTLVGRGREFTFLDGFSANDPESLERLWGAWRSASTTNRTWSVLMSTRADRPLRTSRFCEWVSGRNDVDRVYVSGSHRQAASMLLRRRGVDVVDVGESPRHWGFFEHDDEGDRETGLGVLVGVGNAKGLGLQMRSLTAGGGDS